VSAPSPHGQGADLPPRRRIVRFGIPAAVALCALAAVARSETADSIMASAKEAKRLATCVSGFVWREANEKDLVCAPPAARDRVVQENRQAGQRRAGGGPYGADSCKAGFVWRDAFAGDHVCVPPASRDLAGQENALAAQRRVRH
jgi:hypothetical protein